MSQDPTVELFINGPINPYEYGNELPHRVYQSKNQKQIYMAVIVAGSAVPGQPVKTFTAYQGQPEATGTWSIGGQNNSELFLTSVQSFMPVSGQLNLEQLIVLYQPR